MKKISVLTFLLVLSSCAMPAYTSLVDDPEPVALRHVQLEGGGGSSFKPVTTLTVAFTCEGNEEWMHVGLENCPAADPDLPHGTRGVYWFGATSNFGIGGFWAIGLWIGFPQDGPNGPLALDAYCDNEFPYYVRFPVLRNDGPDVFYPMARIIKLEPDDNGDTGLFWPFRLVDPPIEGVYAQTFPNDWNNLPPNETIQWYNSSQLVYTFGSPGGNEAIGNWEINTPHCVNGNVHHGAETRWTCGKQFMGTGQTCYGDFTDYTFKTAGGAACVPSRYNFDTQAYDILMPTCYDALLSPRTNFWQRVAESP